MSSGAGVTQTTVFVDGRNSKVCAKDTLVEMDTFGKLKEWPILMFNLKLLLGELIIKTFLLVHESHQLT